MVSWIIQLHATGELKAMGATLTAGVMFGGGSYGCYRVPLGSYPDSGPAPLAQCANCNASADCWTVGHSNDILKLTGRQPCCSFCCPQNFTEQYYVDHPERYVDHPPTFLVQVRFPSVSFIRPSLNTFYQSEHELQAPQHVL
eukprot:SAG31_NODE_1061_length_10108_cov_5.521930_8_plen_142_part_00